MNSHHLPDGGTIHVFMCGNLGIFDGLLLCSLSIAKYTRRPVSLYVGTMDLCELDPRFLPVGERERATLERALREANPESRVTLLDLGENFRRELISSKNLGTGYTPYAMIRLFADELDALPDKLIYLDADVMLCKDLGELYDVDVAEHDLAGVRDYYGKVFIGRNYLNSGVMLWNLKRIREAGIFRRAVKLCNERKMLLMDQTAINKYAKKKLILPPKFNEQHKWKPETVVQHFSMRIRWFPLFKTEKIKPWNFDAVHERLKLHYHDEVFAEFQKIKSAYLEEPRAAE